MPFVYQSSHDRAQHPVRRMEAVGEAAAPGAQSGGGEAFHLANRRATEQVMAGRERRSSEYR